MNADDAGSGGAAGASLARCGIDAVTVLESTTDCVIVLDREWRFLYFNGRAKALIGGGCDRIGGNIWQEFPRPPGTAFETACRKVMAERVPVRCEDVYPPLGIWFENSIFPCGEGIAVYFRDVTAQKRQTEALRESEEQSRQQLAELEAIYATTPVGLAVLSPDCRFLRINEQIAAINGLSVAAHLGRSIREILPQFADLLETVACRVVETGEPVRDLEVEGETLARPGDKRAWIAQWLPQKDASGRVVSINVVVEDVTERKRIEQELRDAQARSRDELERVVLSRTREISEANEQLRREKEFTELILASTTEGILSLDRELRYTLWNPAMEWISGMSAAQVIGRVATEVFP